MAGSCLVGEELERRRWEPEILEHIRRCPRCSVAVDTVDAILKREDGVTSIPAESERTAESKARDAGSTSSELPIVQRAAYRLGAEIARGGMGRIMAATDLRVGRRVAIKEALKESSAVIARFEHEAKITARLQHPSIIPIYEVARWPDGTPFYSMREVTGRTLRSAIQSARSLPERLELLPVLITAAEAIAYAHSKGILHRDLKPSNVLIGEHGETVVIDWGLAKDITRAPSSEPRFLGTGRVDENRESCGPPSLTSAGDVVGTPFYMPPEQARGDALDQRADVYALGAILYEIVAGVPPYVGSLHPLNDVLSTEPRSLELVVSALPPDLLSIVHKAMARDRSSRYAEVSEFAADLRRFRTGGAVRAHAYDTRHRARRWIRKRQRVLGVLAAVAVAAAFLAVLTGRRNPTETSLRDRDLGRMTLVLTPFDWNEQTQVATPVPVSELPDLTWTLHDVDRRNGENVGARLAEHLVIRGPTSVERGGHAVAQLVDARGGEAYLEITGRGRHGETCSSAKVFLRHVPGYAERNNVLELRIPVPTCEASRAGMVAIPAGTYAWAAQGSSEPRFQIDKTEVSNAAFDWIAGASAFAEINHDPYPPDSSPAAIGRPKRPVTGVRYATSQRYCRLLGKELPTESQWLRALWGGPLTNKPWPPPYPAPVARKVGPGQSGALEVGTNPDDVSPFGVHDLVSNVREWVQRDDGTQNTMGLGWDDPNAGGQLQRDGTTTWNGNLGRLVPPGGKDFQTGFRCVDAVSPPSDRESVAETPAPVAPPTQPAVRRGLPPSDGTRDIKDTWLSAAHTALAARRDPDLIRGNRYVGSIDRCAAQVSARSQQDAALSQTTFAHRNGGGWHTETDEFNGALRMARYGDQTYSERAAAAGDKSLTERTAIELAAGFLATNYDLFGLDRDDMLAVGEARIVTGPPGPRDEVKTQYVLELNGERPEPAFKDLTSMNRKWTLHIEVDIAGYVRMAMGRIDELHDLKICDRARLDAKTVTERIVGQSFAIRRGRNIANGPPVTASDIVSVKPDIQRLRQHDPERVIARRVYEVSVTRASDDFIVIIDADTGGLVTSYSKTPVFD